MSFDGDFSLADEVPDSSEGQYRGLGRHDLHAQDGTVGMHVGAHNIDFLLVFFWYFIGIFYLLWVIAWYLSCVNFDEFYHQNSKL